MKAANFAPREAPRWRMLLQASIKEVFQVMLSAELTPAGYECAHSGSIVTAFVGIGGDLSGVATIVTGSEAAREMASAMLGMPAEEVDGEAFDALGEICHMVAGNFKGKLADIAEDCVLSLPTVVTGDDYHLHVLHGGTSLEARLLFKGKLMSVLLEIHP